jgi:hypothetical protein
MKKFIQVTTFLSVLLVACSKNLPEVGGTSAEKVANEWWVTLKMGNDDLLGTHVKLVTYNTSADNDSMWIDDLGNIWQFKCKAKVDYPNLTFLANDAPNDYYDITVNIANGKVIQNGGVSKTGNVTDSIYFETKFSDDPDNTYIISGTARTRYAEDDY